MSEYKAFKQVAYYKNSGVRVNLDELPSGALENLIQEEKVDMRYEDVKGNEIPKKDIIEMLQKWERECT